MESEESLMTQKIERWTELAKECLTDGEVNWGESYITKALEKLKRVQAAVK